MPTREPPDPVQVAHHQQQVERVRERLRAERVTKMAQELAVSMVREGGCKLGEAERYGADERALSRIADLSVKIARRILDHENNPHLFG